MRDERHQVGGDGEELAAEAMVRAGFTVRDRNVRCRRGELDIVAEKGELVVFVEVRSRTTATWGDPALTVMGAKQRKVVMAAMEYLQRHRLQHRALRFDVASVVGRGREAHVELIPGAFDAGV